MNHFPNVSRAFFVFAFLLLSTTFLSGQTKTNKATVKEGPEQEAKKSSVTDISGYDETGYYIVRRQKKSLFLEHINKDLAVDKSFKLPKQKHNGLPLYFDFCTMVDGQLFLFSSLKDSHNNKLQLFSQKVDKSTLMPETEMKEVASTVLPSRRQMMHMLVYGEIFTHYLSPDGTKLLISCAGNEATDETQAENAPSTFQFHFTIFGSNMEKVWDKNVKLPYSSDLFSIDQLKVDDNGNVFIIGEEFEEKSTARQSRKDGKPSYTFHVFRYSANNSDKADIPVDLQGKFITDMQADNTPQGDIVICGFYSEKGTFSIKGAFYMLIDGSSYETKVSKLTEFDKEFMMQNTTAREQKQEKKQEAKGKDPELYNFRMDELLVKQDGGVTMIAEQFSIDIVPVTYYDAATKTYRTTYYYYYNYNDILVLSFDSQGALQWKTKIPKRQTTVNDGGYYSSYAYSVVGDKIYFVFNDNPKNLFLKDGEAPYEFSGSKELAVVLVEVDNTGKSSRELLFTTDKKDLIVRPKMCEQTGANEMLICSERPKLFQFSKVTFK